MFFKSTTRTFWVFYDNLFKGMFQNLVVFLFLFGTFALLFMKFQMHFTAILTLIGLWHVVAPAIMYYWIKIIKTEENDGMLREIGRGFKIFFLRGLAVLLMNLAFLYIGYLAVEFYKGMNALKPLMVALGGIGIWIIIMFVLVQIYVMPIMVLDEKKRIFTSYKKAAIMLMASPFSSIFVGVLIAYCFLLSYPVFAMIFRPDPMPWLFAFIALAPIFLMPFLSIIMIMLLQVNCTMIIYEKHGVIDDLSEVWEDRSMSNFFRPWESKK